MGEVVGRDVPGGGLAVWSFDYRLNQPGAEDVSRGYVLWTPQLALGTDVPLSDRLTLVADGLASVPVAHQPLIFSGTLVGRYRLFERGRAEADVQLGVSFDRIDYRDNQEVPNDVSIDAGPMVVAAEPANPAYPCTLDLRWRPVEGGDAGFSASRSGSS